MISFVVRLRRRAHFVVKGRISPGNRSFVGASARRRNQARQRLGILMAGFCLAFLVIGARLFQYGLVEPVLTASIGNTNTIASRPDIIDRNGELLATDLDMVSLYADPRRIVDADEVVEKLAAVIRDLDWSEAPADAETTGRHSRSRYSWHRFSAGKAAILPRWGDRIAHCWACECRQSRTGGHGAISGPARTC